MITRAAKVLASSCVLVGCAHYPTNAPLDGVDAVSGYRIRAPVHDGTSHELLFVVTFSGGGTRSAAFAYGVLAALNDIEVELDGGQRRLVNEIDGISSVSAGSVTAAYFGLHGPSTFDTFPERFLYRNVQGALTRRFLAPWNWVRLMSPTFGRSDFMAEYFDDVVFDERHTPTSSIRRRSSSTRRTSMRAPNSRSIRISSTCCARTSRASR